MVKVDVAVNPQKVAGFAIASVIYDLKNSELCVAILLLLRTSIAYEYCVRVLRTSIAVCSKSMT